MATVKKMMKKACKGVSYPKSSSVSSRLGSPSKKMAKGGSFPDLNKDGKVTKKDILIGKGVLPKTAKKGMKVKKAQSGIMKKISDTKLKDVPSKAMKVGKRFIDKVKNTTVGDVASAATSTLPGFIKSSKKQKMGGKTPKSMKTGGKTKKCMYGCK